MKKQIKNSRGFYLQRLVDPALLKHAVVVKNSCDSGAAGDSLAVPCGGSRQGGYLEFVDEEEAEKALELLSRRPGFPNLHIVYIPEKYEHPIFTLVWGDPQDRVMTVEELGRYYGYKKTAIQDEIKWQKSAGLA